MSDDTPRVLIAERDQSLAATLCNLIHEAVRNVELAHVDNGQQAWNRLKLESFDLVVSAWEMESMSGGDLLLSVRGHYRTRNLPFIMLTSRKDRISVMYAIRSGVTAYITKPFDPGLFVERIVALLTTAQREQAALAAEGGEEGFAHQQAGRQRAVEGIMQRIRVGEVDLPVLPEIATKVNQAVSKANARIKELSELLRPDASLSAKLIAIANSPYYRGVRKLVTLDDTIIRLGFNQIRNYILVITTRGLFHSDDPYFGALLRRLWLHCVATAAAARAIAQHIRTLDQDILYSKGLLHDIGKLILLQTVVRLPNRHLDDEAVGEILDNMHTEYGAALLKHWRYPTDFQDACLCHHDVGGGDEWAPELLVVAFANRLVRHLGWSLKEPESREELLADDSARLLGIGPEVLAAILGEVREYVDEIQVMVWGRAEGEG